MARDANAGYPVGTPFRAPSDSSTQLVRLRRWALALFVAAALFLVTAVAAGVFLFNVAARAQERPPDEEAPKAETRKSSPPEARAERLLEALGGLSAAHLYQSFLNLGLLADSVEGDVYTRAEAEKMLSTMLGLMDQVDDHLQSLKDAGLDRDDQRSVENLRKVSTALRAQAEALRAYWKTDGKDEESRYHAAREEAWAALRALMKKQ